MSKSYSIQKKLWKSYGKVGKILGSSYEIFRSQSLSNPLNDANFIDTKTIAFSKDDKFKSGPSAGVSMWTAWLDGRLENLFDIQKGDYFRNIDTNQVYVVSSIDDHKPIQVVKAPDIISVKRSGYTETAGSFGIGDADVAVNVPCWIEQVSASGGTNGYIPAASYSTDALSNVEIYIFDPKGEIEVRDAVVDGLGNRYQVLNINNSDIVTRLTAKKYDPS